MAPTGGSNNSAADLVEVVRYYVDKMLREVPGMKVLLLDAETTRVVSTVFSQSEILEQEVYLVERLDADKGDQLLHLKASAGLRVDCCTNWQVRLGGGASFVFDGLR
jgi:vacuolar protein sorting-associated protein 45